MKIKKNGKVVNLTESDLKRIVKRTLSEQDKKVRYGSTANNPLTMQFFMEDLDDEYTGKVIGGTVNGKKGTMVIEIDMILSPGKPTVKKFVEVSSRDFY